MVRKRPRSFCQNVVAGYTYTHEYTLDPTQLLCRHSAGTYQENELTRNLSEDTRPQSSQLAEQLWTNPGLKSGISVRELICTKKKKKKRTRLMNGRTFSPNSRKRRNSHHHHHHCGQDFFFFFWGGACTMVIAQCPTPPRFF